MRDQKNLEDLIKVHPDFIGFIFFEKSKRHVSEFPEVAMPQTIKKVGVFVNETPEEVLNKVRQHNLNVVQLHGDESPAYCVQLKQSDEELEIFKAFSIDEDFDFEITTAYEEVCDLFIFDTKGKERGGNGVKFDWTLLESYTNKTPYLLSGGIGLEDIDSLKEFMRSPIAQKCAGVDVNSGFESEPGVKIIEELKQFKEILP